MVELFREQGTGAAAARSLLADILHRGDEVARYRRSYEQGVWLPPPIMRAEPPAAAPPVVLPRLAVAPPELTDYAELCA